MKKIWVSLLVTMILSTGHSQNFKWIKFNWVGDSTGGRYFEKLAIDLPVQIENLPYKFTMQFDLGATNSIIYGNEITPYLDVNKQLRDKIDTSLKIWIDSKQYPTFKRIDLKLDNISFDNINLGYYKGYGDSLTTDSVKSTTVKTIGTIGADFFKDKVLIIDYPNQRICILDAIPKNFMPDFNFTDIKFTDGVILIPVQIGGKDENLMFDTGSSLFALYTNEKNASDISDANAMISDSLKLTSWGKTYYSYGKKATEIVKIGNSVMPITLAYYDKREWAYFFVSHNIWGITGNAYFLKNRVIVDFKNQKFGISKSVN